MWKRSRTSPLTPSSSLRPTSTRPAPCCPPDRRAALVAWAARRNAVIIEDDYDAEFRFDRQPIGAIQGLDPDRVIYAGSASKVLAPGLRLGWLAVPPNLVDAVTQAKKTADQGSPAIEQLTFADFIERGELDHHLRRLRPIYRERRDALLQALARHLPDVRPVGASAGLHVSPGCPTTSRRAGRSRRGRAGIALTGVAAHRVAPGGDRRPDPWLRSASGISSGCRCAATCDGSSQTRGGNAPTLGKGEPEGRSGEAERFEDARRPRL